MSLDHDIQALSRVKLFDGFDEEHLRLLAFGSQTLSFSAATQIYYHDQPSDGAYLILSGAVEIWIEKGGEQIVFDRAQQGQLVGHLSLFTRNMRVGTATAVEDTRGLHLSRATMTRVLEEYPHLAAQLYDRIASEVARFTRELERVEQKLGAA